MKRKLLLLDYAILFFGTSYYLGTGWSTAITQFPIMPKLTVSNYYLHFVPQVAASTGFFNWLVPIMINVHGAIRRRNLARPTESQASPCRNPLVELSEVWRLSGGGGGSATGCFRFVGLDRRGR